MDIGSLFLNLGVKGADKAVQAFVPIQKGLSETASLSLEAKAGIIGAMYALERLFDSSGKAGTNLSQFNAFTGQSVQTLQQYQYAARQVGVSNEETASSFKGLQSAMTKTLMGQGAPSGLARVSQLVGGISTKDINEFTKNPELLIQKLQSYAQKEKNIGLRNETLKSFGLSENFIAGLSKNAFNPGALKKAPTYSDKEVGNLDRANIAWSNLGNTVQMSIGHFNAMHGEKLVGDISKIVGQVVKLTEALLKLADKLHLFEGISKTLGVISSAAEGGSKIIGALSGNQKDKKSVFDAFKNIPAMLNSNPYGAESGAITPHAPKQLGSNNNQQNDIVINNNFQHEGKDHKKTEDSVKRSVQQAVRQLSSLSQAT